MTPDHRDSIIEAMAKALYVEGVRHDGDTIPTPEGFAKAAFFAIESYVKGLDGDVLVFGECECLCHQPSAHRHVNAVVDDTEEILCPSCHGSGSVPTVGVAKRNDEAAHSNEHVHTHLNPRPKGTP